MLKHIDAGWEDWADWISRHIERSAIGYPSQTVESRMMEAAGADRCKPGSISPEVMMPPRVSKYDRVYNAMNGQWQHLIHLRYTERKRKLSRGQYRELERLHYWTDGQLLAVGQNCANG